MAGLSRSIFSLLEVLTSTDLATAFRLGGRDTLELARWLTGNRPAVLGGLEVTALGAGVQVAPGALLEPFSGLVSPPKADESPTILGLLRAPVTLAVPALGVTTAYRIEARAAELDTTGSRAVADQTAQTTSPVAGLVVQRECGLVLQAMPGSAINVPPAPTPGWQTIAIVNKTPTGNIDPAAITDVRFQVNLGALKDLITQTGADADEATGLVSANLDVLSQKVQARDIGRRSWSVTEGRTAEAVAAWKIYNLPAAISSGGTAQYFVPLLRLTHGATLVGVDARILPGTARGAGNRMRIQLQKLDVTTVGAGWVAITPYVYDAGTAVEQILAITGQTEVIDLTQYAYQAVILSGADGDTNPDKIFGGTFTIA